MTDPLRSLCPTCGSTLIAVGALRLCLDCAYQDALPEEAAPVADAALTPDEVSMPDLIPSPNAISTSEGGEEEEGRFSPVVPEPERAEGADALWLPPRRRKGGVTTPLGFQAGHPCPRVCGGELVESGGALLCTTCDFRYPDDPDSAQAAGAFPHSTMGNAERTTAGDTTGEVDTLRREVERLREENRKLVMLVTDMMQGIRSLSAREDPSPAPPPREASPPPD